MTKRKLIIATRESPLALAQTAIIKKMLLEIHPHLAIEILGITTQADKQLDVNLLEIGGKGLFVKELEEALLAGHADIAVHSMKDVPMELPPGLCLPVICKREEPRDVFVSNQYESFLHMPHGASIGTSSLRRQTQLLALRADLTYQNLRGNVNTRLRRLDAGDFGAIILAAAGLKRLGLGDRIRSYLSTEQSLPSPGQGALGIECLEDNVAIQQLILSLNDKTTSDCVLAERALCRRIGGGCKVPIAAYAELRHGTLHLRGLVANRDGTRVLRAELSGDPAHAVTIGTRVGEELLQQGAQKILREFE